MQAELEWAKDLVPETYRLAKIKIYEDRKIILSPDSNEQVIEEATDDAAAAAAQLMSALRKKQSSGDKEVPIPPEIIEKEAINNLVNEGGPVQ